MKPLSMCPVVPLGELMQHEDGDQEDEEADSEGGAAGHGDVNVGLDAVLN